MKTKLLFVLAFGAIFWSCFFVSLAQAGQPVVSVKIISDPQTIATDTPSGIFTIEAQDSSGKQANVATTTRVSLSSTSISGQFLTSPAAGPCNSATTSSLTIANNTAHKSFCYIDSTPGNYTLTLFVPDQPSILGDSQIIVISGPTSSSMPDATATSTPESSQTATTTKSMFIKISEVLPNPAGEDAGNEVVELVNNGTSTVDLTGWFLSDSRGTSTAYQLPTSTEISAGKYLSITIPSGNYSLNNDGDTVNLYYSDLTLADSQTYITSAGEGKGWQYVDGVWQWAPATLGFANAASPSQTQSPGASGAGGSSAVSVGSPSDNNISAFAAIQISEFLPNPSGDDSGKEWVELYNPGSATTSFSGWKLDDGGTSDTPGASAYALAGSLAIGPKSFLVITIPAGKFALNNSGDDAMRLFKPDGSLAQSINYKDAPEGQSFSVNEFGKRLFGLPTPGLPNNAGLPPASVIISELLPNPAGSDDEFVEIYNTSTSTAADLKGFKLSIGSREKIFDDVILAPNTYFVLYQDDLPVNLRNSGQTIKLLDPLGRLADSMAYNKAEAGQAYALADGGSYFWTESPTPGKANSIVLSASTESAMPAKATASSKDSAPAKPDATLIKLYNAVSLTNQKIAGLETKMDGLTQAVAAEASAVAEAPTVKISPSNQDPPLPSSAWRYLAVSLAALAILGLIVKFYFFSNRP